MNKTSVFIGLRLAVGLLYLISGAQKLLQPYENFLYVIRGYEIVHHSGLEQFIALTFPWIEYFLGGFLLAGLWMKFNLIGIGIFSSVFIVNVGQAMARRLPIQECGCFGDLVGVPLWGTFLIDVVTLIFIIIMINFLSQSSIFGIDNYLNKGAIK